MARIMAPDTFPSADSFQFPVYVINLDRSPQRLAHITRHLGEHGLPFTRITAVDGAELAADVDGYDPERARRNYFVPMHEGEIACFLSHRRAWKTFLEESDAPFCLVLEDDVELADGFRDAIEAIAKLPVGDWDIIKIYSRNRRFGRTVRTLTPQHRLVRFMVQPLGTVGALISRDGARRLLDGTLPITRPIDVQLQHWWELGASVLTVDPPLVREISDRLDGSELGVARTRAREGRLHREVQRALYRAGVFLKSAYHHAVRTAG